MSPTTATKEEAPVVEKPPALQLPVEVVLTRFHPMQVVLVGAGGTGARLGTDIARLLTRGDRLLIIDPDRVETRNLIRQHFVRGDVGRYKAEVVARRAQIVAAQGVSIESRITALDNLGTVPNLQDRNLGIHVPTLWVGAVDTRKCRQMAATYLNSNPRSGLWIDVGNEMRGGQVGMWGGWLAQSVKAPMTGKVWPTPAQEQQIKSYVREGYTRDRAMAAAGPWVYMNTIAEITPSVLQPDVEEEAKTTECPIRIDTQSLAANVMAYCAVINLVSRVLDGLNISVGASFFSTNNTMQGKPFLYVGGENETTLALGVSQPFKTFNDLRTFVTKAMQTPKLQGEGVTTKVAR